MTQGPTLLSMVAGLGVLSGAFWLLERGRPSLPLQRRSPRERRTDLAYWFFTPLVTRMVTRAAIATGFVLIASWRGMSFAELRHAVASERTVATALPLWIQVPLILLLADLLAYWTHRIFHGRTLWKFHAIHHSSRTVTWISSVRLHPVNDVVARVVQVFPLYWLGFNGAALAGVVPVLTVYALLLHANLDWTYGPLRYAIASPTFHRWHHTSQEEGLDTNFAGLFPFIDLAFGTFYMPRGRRPERFGVVGEQVPEGLLAQLAYPFRSKLNPSSAPADGSRGRAVQR